MSQMKAQIDKLLTNVLIEYSPSNFIADRILPELKVAQYSGKIGKRSTSHLRLQQTLVGGRGLSPMVELRTVETDSYQIEKHALKGMITPEDMANYDKPFNAEKDEAMALKLAMLVAREKALADAISSTSIITQNTTLSGTSQFTDKSNSNPIGIVETAHGTIKDNCGAKANIAILSDKVARSLRYHPDVINHLKGSNGAKKLSEQELADFLEVDEVLISDAMYNNTNKGGDDHNLTRIWGNDLIFAVAPRQPVIGQVSLGYTARLAGKAAFRVAKWNVEDPEDVKMIRVNDDRDDILTNVKAAYLVKDAV